MKLNRANLAMEPNLDALAKIRSDRLRTEAENADRTPHTVIVEVDVPLPAVEMSSREAVTSGRKLLRFSKPAVDANLLQGIKRALAEALGHEPKTYLASSRSFIVEATGDEMRRVAQIPNVLAIWPNSRRFGSLPM